MTISSISTARLPQADRIGTDPAGNEFQLHDGFDGARDITDVYASEGNKGDDYRFQVNLADLPPGAANGKTDLYMLVDCRKGGRTDLPDGFKNTTDHPWELAAGLYDDQHHKVLSADGQQHPGALKTVHFDSAHNAVEFTLDKDVLRAEGWQDHQALNLQFFTAHDFDPRITDTATPDKPWNTGGVLNGALTTPGKIPAPAPTPTPEPQPSGAKPKIYVALHWHMHQPIYWPGQNIVQTSHNPKCTDDPVGVVTWPDRVGGYTHYMADAIDENANLPHMGAQVSWTGSLTQDINALADHGITFGHDWMARYRAERLKKTVMGNPRMDFVGIGFDHPLMPLTTTGNLAQDRDMELQVATQRDMIKRTFGGPASHGFFPPEQAFTERMVPVLKKQGYDWVEVDNLHVDRANKDFPWSSAEKMEPPNKADQVNSKQGPYVNLHCEQNTSNAVSAEGLRPHYTTYTDPATGKKTRMVVVPCERSLGYDDSYGDRSPLPRLEQLQKLNTDPKHPLLVVLAHDGDNFGASGSRYYDETMRWVQQDRDNVEVTTVQDYLDRFPPDKDDVVHVEDGSWTGADIGNPEFGKWLGKPYDKQGKVDYTSKGYSPDRNSWSVLVAAENRVMTADKLQPPSSLQAVENGTGNETDKAWHLFMQGETSCYEYWDGQDQWDSKPTIACNLAVEHADKVIGDGSKDSVGPTLFALQRHPYNPGGHDDEDRVNVAPESFTVWTMGYDVSGIKRIELKWRVDTDPSKDDLYAGDWSSQPMQGQELEPRTSAKPKYQATEYSAEVKGAKQSLIQYYVEAEDGKGNITRSPISRVWVK